MIVVSRTSAGITVEGHAGYAETGSDIVCAAVSALTVNLINSIELLTEDDVDYFKNEETGYIDLRFKDLSERGKLLVDSFFIGIQAMSEMYKDYVQVI